MRRRGFTLLEAVVALALAALVLTALYGAVGRAAAARTRGAASADRMAAARTLLLGLAAELEAALVPSAADRLVVAAPPAAGPPWSSLRFVAFRGGPAAHADDVRRLTYRVEGALPGVLVRRSTDLLAPRGVAEPPGVALVEGVRAFRVRCFDGATWTAAWSGTELPRAVEVAIAVDDGAGGTLDLATTVALARRSPR